MAGSSPSNGEGVVWRVLPVAAPRVLRPCARCDRIRPFAPTDKFRLNAQQRHIDAWLLYRCADCDSTWKREIFRRTTPERIGADLYERLLRNDPLEAERIAFDTAGLAIEKNDGARIVRPAGAIGAPVRITLVVPYACHARLDRLLAGELGISREMLRAGVRRRLIVIEPGGESMLRRTVRDGLSIEVTTHDFVPPSRYPAHRLREAHKGGVTR